MGLEEAVEVLSGRWPLFAVAGATFLGAGAVRHLYRWSILNAIPMLGEELGGSDKRKAAYTTGAKKLYQEGYNKVSSIELSTTANETPL